MNTSKTNVRSIIVAIMFTLAFVMSSCKPTVKSNDALGDVMNSHTNANIVCTNMGFAVDANGMCVAK